MTADATNFVVKVALQFVIQLCFRFNFSSIILTLIVSADP